MNESGNDTTELPPTMPKGEKPPQERTESTDGKSTKELIEALGAELHYTNQLLEQQNALLQSLVEPDEPEEQLYECDLCSELIGEDNREGHMVNAHGMPKGVSFESKYSEV